MKVYLSGPITGIQKEVVTTLFALAEDIVRNLGDTPVNPLSNGLPYESPWEEHLHTDLNMLKDCDYIFMLDGWENSNGAIIEYSYACFLGIEMYNSHLREEIIFAAVHIATHIRKEDILSSSRKRSIVQAREIASYLFFEVYQSLSTVGIILFHDRNTIRHSIWAYHNDYKLIPSFKAKADMAINIIHKLETT